jgi:hypothetical protein
MASTALLYYAYSLDEMKFATGCSISPVQTQPSQKDSFPSSHYHGPFLCSFLDIFTPILVFFSSTTLTVTYKSAIFS